MKQRDEEKTKDRRDVRFKTYTLHYLPLFIGFFLNVEVGIHFSFPEYRNFRFWYQLLLRNFSQDVFGLDQRFSLRHWVSSLIWSGLPSRTDTAPPR